MEPALASRATSTPPPVPGKPIKLTDVVGELRNRLAVAEKNLRAHTDERVALDKDFPSEAPLAAQEKEASKRRDRRGQLDFLIAAGEEHVTTLRDELGKASREACHTVNQSYQPKYAELLRERAKLVDMIFENEAKLNRLHAQHEEAMCGAGVPDGDYSLIWHDAGGALNELRARSIEIASALEHMVRARAEAK